jgi:alpha-maltose-1-phosphate synthase
MDALLFSADPGIPLDGPSGASAHLRGIGRALGRAGHGVTVAVPCRSDHRGAVEDPLDARVIAVAPMGLRRLPGSWRERGEWLDGRRLARAAGVHELVWERFSGFGDARGTAPLRIVEVNAPVARERAAARRLYDPRFAASRERAILKSADRVIAVSRWLVDWLVAEVGVPADRVRHVPNGVEARVGDRDATRRRLGLDGPVLGFVGSMKPWHGVERLPAILDALPGFTALVAGDGPIAVPRHPRLRALGRVPPRGLADVVAAMDVGLAPYAADAPPWFCPLKVLEYRAQGVPVVAADVGECRSLGASIVADDDWCSAIEAALGHPRVPWVRSWDDVVVEALAGLPGISAPGTR